MRIAFPSCLIVIGCCLAIAPSSACAQFAVGGVYIDADGMLRHAKTLADEQRNQVLKSTFAGGPSDGDLARASQLRKVSLRKLEAAVQAHHAKQEQTALPSELAYLAGLTGVKYVIFQPEERDVILAGPAEGWKVAESGEVVGVESGRPVLHLEDVIATLRYAFRTQPGTFIGCSINPTVEGQKRFAAYLSKLGRIDRSRIKPIFAGMEQAMGNQAARILGVPETSRAGQVMLAADYRLKRIAMGHDPPPVDGLVSYLDTEAKRFRGGAIRQHRFWFIAQYDAVFHTPDELAFEFSGQGIKVATAPTQVSKTGKDLTAGPAATQFTTALTKRFAEVAKKIPVFAELQNITGLATAAELIAEKQRGTERESHWRPTHFLDASHCPVAEHHTPREVPSLANFRLVRNRHWLITVSGGVEINPRANLTEEVRQPAVRREINTLGGRLSSKSGATWWWD